MNRPLSTTLPLTERSDGDTEPCFDCDGVGTVILGEWNDPSAREVRCDTCFGWGVTDIVPERIAA
jgi:hypothetical protein